MHQGFPIYRNITKPFPLATNQKDGPHSSVIGFVNGYRICILPPVNLGPE